MRPISRLIATFLAVVFSLTGFPSFAATKDATKPQIDLLSNAPSDAVFEAFIRLCQDVDILKSAPSRGKCAKAAYEARNIWPAMVGTAGCSDNSKKSVIDIAKCEEARYTLETQQAKTEAESKKTKALEAENTEQLKTTNRSGQAGSVDPNLRVEKNQLWSLPMISACLATLLSLVIATILFYNSNALRKEIVVLKKERDSLVQTITDRDAEIQGLKSNIQTTAEKTRIALESIARSPSDSEQEKPVIQTGTHNSAEAFASAAARRDASSIGSLGRPSPQAYQHVLVETFKSLSGRGVQLPKGREFEAFVAAISDEQVSRFVTDQGPRIHRLLDSNGASTASNPTLVAMAWPGGLWLIFPFPFAERTGMYRRWFDGFDDSKSMTALRPAIGKDNGGVVEPTSKGQLA